MPLVFSGNKFLKYWNGSSWQNSKDFARIKVWNGSSWVRAGLQVYEDIAVTFSPDGSTSSGSPTYLSDYNIYPASATVTINASIPATWTYSYTGSAPSVSVASGGSANSITFILYSDFYSYLSSTISLSGSAAGTTKYWTIQLNSDGNI